MATGTYQSTSTIDVETNLLVEHDDRDLPHTQSSKCRRYAPAIGLAVFVVVSVAILLPISLVVLRSDEAAQGLNGMVATEEPRCSEIGKQVLVDGGSATDAAIAAGLCVGVLNNFASGIGGGGFLLVRDQDDRNHVFDFREEAPAAAHKDMFVDQLDLGVFGGLASGVPGEVRGYYEAHAMYGKLEWKRLFEPSIALARDGFQVSSILAQRLTQIPDLVLSDPLWGASYAVNGRVAVEGDTIYRTALASTLQIIAEQGPDGFYAGPIAESIIEALRSTGGNMTLQDLAEYQVKVREPLIGFYRGKRVLTSPPPSSGAVLLFLLNVMEGYPLSAEGPTVLSHQYITEAMKFAYAQRSYLGDPDFVVNMTSTLDRIMSKEFAYQVRRNISDSVTHPPEYYGGEYEIEETPGTTHISVLDRNGNVASLTSTVNLAWGSRVMTTSGIIMNNQMDDFSTPGTENAYGLRASPANFIAAKKRPLSSSVPVAMFDDEQPTFVAGASGGSRIITGTFYTLLNYADFHRDLLSAVKQPRIHHQLYPNQVDLEHGFSASVGDGLTKNGHVVNRQEEGASMSVVQAVARGFDGTLFGASDPRKNGLAVGF